ncbi:MAG: phosphoribosylformylglycinamidine synthase subunit PurQ [Bacteroidia bacterium]
MKFGIITFPGSNCDNDLIYAMKENLGQEVVQLWHKDHDIQGCDFIFVPGGFSYGDYLRSGAIARFSPIMQEVIAHAERGGYVMGICNGFQILCEAGLLDGALLHNESTRFVCKNVNIRPASRTAMITKGLELKAYKIPIAHGEGNYYCDDDTLKSLQDNDQILFRYCDEQGIPRQEANPNGSIFNIAGISNEKHNVFGMMPHPERASDRLLANIDGARLLEQLV